MLPQLWDGKKGPAWNHIHKDRKLCHWILNLGSWKGCANVSKLGHEFYRKEKQWREKEPWCPQVSEGGRRKHRVLRSSEPSVSSSFRVRVGSLILIQKPSETTFFFLGSFEISTVAQGGDHFIYTFLKTQECHRAHRDSLCQFKGAGHHPKFFSLTPNKLELFSVIPGVQ